MTTMDLTVRLAPILFAMLATFLFSSSIIIAQAMRNLQEPSWDFRGSQYAIALLGVLLVLVSVVVARESVALSVLLR